MMSEKNDLRRELAALEKMSAKQLRQKYRELFGDESRTGNRRWLLRRCAWRLQARAEGGLSRRAKRRAMEIADDADVRFIPPRRTTADENKPRQVYSTDIKPDDRLPMPGTQLIRVFKGRVYEVTVQPGGFEYDGEFYKSLSAVAHAITGSHWNGYHFFKKALTSAKQARRAG
jgi:hypothetical protein